MPRLPTVTSSRMMGFLKSLGFKEDRKAVISSLGIPTAEQQPCLSQRRGSWERVD